MGVACCCRGGGEAFEIHVGRSEISVARRPFAVVTRSGIAVDELDGALSEGGHVLGTYLHGLFANDALRRALLEYLAERRHRAPDARWGAALPMTERYDRLADIIEATCDVAGIAKLVGLELSRRTGKK